MCGPDRNTSLWATVTHWLTLAVPLAVNELKQSTQFPSSHKVFCDYDDTPPDNQTDSFSMYMCREICTFFLCKNVFLPSFHICRAVRQGISSLSTIQSLNSPHKRANVFLAVSNLSFISSTELQFSFGV